MSWCGNKGHWASSNDRQPSNHPIKASVRRQVEHVRNTKSFFKGTPTQLQDPDQDCTQQRQQTPESLRHALDGDASLIAERGILTSETSEILIGRPGQAHAHVPHCGDRCRPAEMEVSPKNKEEYESYRKLNDLRAPYRVPRVYLYGTKKFLDREIPDAPLIVFINSRSGGRAGPRLKEVLCRTIGRDQVYDLHDCRPADVLRCIWENLADAEESGDSRAAYFRSSLRILAAGGDGTVAWLLGTIADLGLTPPPRVAVLPLGTGNDLSLSFGWGNTFLAKWLENYASVYELLRRIAEAQPRELDCWQITLTAERKEQFDKLPYSLVASAERTSLHQVEGRFWNYMSVGVDAEAAYRFHHLREKRPWATRGRLSNQAWYSYFGFTTGGYVGAPPIRDTVQLQVRRGDGATLEELPIPSEVKALLVLNLQSYGGGRDMWGLDTDPAKLQRQGFAVPIFNDGLLEVVGLRGTYHTGWVMSGISRCHSVRLAQVPALRLSLRSSSNDVNASAYMQLDGEPWRQSIPSAADSNNTSLTVDIRQADVSHMLCNPELLKGMARKVQALAAREVAVSAETPSQAERNRSMLSSPLQPSSPDAKKFSERVLRIPQCNELVVAVSEHLSSLDSCDAEAFAAAAAAVQP